MVEHVVVHNTAHGESLVPPQTRGRATLPAISSGFTMRKQADTRLYGPSSTVEARGEVCKGAPYLSGQFRYPALQPSINCGGTR
jgi:hypothetical protein